MPSSLRRFLNISINFPGSTSDHLAWEGCCFKRTIEKEGFLAALLCLFGDNAYLNSSYLATPFPNAKLEQDDYNFYHSQLRINIECAFGMLVMRWSILTRALSSHYGLKKTKELVRCLCCLHNYCIDENDNIGSNRNVPESCIEDELELITTGAFRLPSATAPQELGGENVVIPEQLMNGGDHADDHTRPRVRDTDTTRREHLLNQIVEGNFRRPT